MVNLLFHLVTFILVPAKTGPSVLQGHVCISQLLIPVSALIFSLTVRFVNGTAYPIQLLKKNLSTIKRFMTNSIWHNFIYFIFIIL